MDELVIDDLHVVPIAPAWWTDEVRSAIDRGVKTLDAEIPTWREEIDLDTLKMESCALCVLGQLYGDYVVGLRALADDPNIGRAGDSGYGVDWGFAAPTAYRIDGTSPERVEDYEARLQRGWKPWEDLNERWRAELGG